MLKSISHDEAEKLVAERKGDPGFSIIDVRTPGEFRQGSIDGAENIDFYETDFREKLDTFDKTKTYLIYCRSGSRSKAALRMMEELGFQEVYEMSGGIMG